jgi:hypothetical protein
MVLRIFQDSGAISGFFEPAKTGFTHKPLVELVRKEYARVRKPTESNARQTTEPNEFNRVYRINRTVSRFNRPEDHAEYAHRGTETNWGSQFDQV